MGLQLAKVMFGSTVLNLSYFLIGLLDNRITALARRRHGNYGFMVDALRIFTLVTLQVLFYIGVGLHAYPAL